MALKQLKKYFKSILKQLYKFEFVNKNFRFLLNVYLQCKYDISINNFENWMSTCKKIQKVKFDDIEFQFIDQMSSHTIDVVNKELTDGSVYDFGKLNFKEGDIVIDIGANIGIVSIYLAKKFPFLKIYSYEPVKQNYEAFLQNININNIPNGVIFPYNMAVTKDGRDVDMSINLNNYGGSSISDVISTGAVMQECNTNIKSTTLQNIFLEHNITHLKLLKIDCEGSEYEILYNTPTDILSKIDILRGEFHENKMLTDEYDIDSLLEYTEKYILNTKIEPAKNCFIM